MVILLNESLTKYLNLPKEKNSPLKIDDSHHMPHFSMFTREKLKEAKSYESPVSCNCKVPACFTYASTLTQNHGCQAYMLVDMPRQSSSWTKSTGLSLCRHAAPEESAVNDSFVLVQPASPYQEWRSLCQDT